MLINTTNDLVELLIGIIIVVVAGTGGRQSSVKIGGRG